MMFYWFYGEFVHLELILYIHNDILPYNNNFEIEFQWHLMESRISIT